MLFRLLKLTSLALLGIALNAQAMPSEARNTLKQLLNEMKTFQANFDETITSHDGVKQGEFSGRVAIKKPGQFYWQVDKPNKQIIAIKGQQIIVYDVDLEQASVDQFSQNNKDLPIAFLTLSPDQVLQDFTVGVVDGPAHFSLKPKKPSGQYHALTLLFDNANHLQQLAFIDGLEQQITINFSQTRTNQAVADSLFNLSFPKTVDVIRGQRS